MCRLLYIRSAKEFVLSEHLLSFAQSVCKQSSEYQGHGWGICYRSKQQWTTYRNISPIWEDDLEQFGTAREAYVHARSAFRDEGIQIENNMPFADQDKIFIFNGELRGVKLKSEGRIGAEKIFNFISRFKQRSLLEALEHATRIIEQRSQHVRAMNIIIGKDSQVCVKSFFSAQPEYFTLHRGTGDTLLAVCSAPYNHPSIAQWKPIPNGTTFELDFVPKESHAHC